VQDATRTENTKKGHGWSMVSIKKGHFGQLRRHMPEYTGAASWRPPVTVLRTHSVRVQGHWHVGPRDALVVDRYCRCHRGPLWKDPGKFPGISRDRRRDSNKYDAVPRRHVDSRPVCSTCNNIFVADRVFFNKPQIKV
jgi:hypothetical protein